MGNYHSIKLTDPYLPSTGFGSEKWAKENGALAADMPMDEWLGIRHALLSGYRVRETSDEDVDAALARVTDAFMLRDMVGTPHPILHELGHQLYRYWRPKKKTEKEWKESEQLRIKYRDNKMFRTGLRFKDYGPEPRSYVEAKAEEAYQASIAEEKGRQERFRRIFTHPAVIRYLPMLWYVDKYGNTPLGRITHHGDGGASDEPIHEGNCFYEVLKEAIGEDLMNNCRLGFAGTHQYNKESVQHAVNNGNKKLAKSGFAVLMKPMEKRHVQKIRTIHSELTSFFKGPKKALIKK